MSNPRALPALSTGAAGLALSVVAFALGELAWRGGHFVFAHWILAPFVFWCLGYRLFLGRLPGLWASSSLLALATILAPARAWSQWSALRDSCLVVVGLTTLSFALEAAVILLAWLLWAVARRTTGIVIRAAYIWFVAFHLTSVAGAGGFYCVGP